MCVDHFHFAVKETLDHIPKNKEIQTICVLAYHPCAFASDVLDLLSRFESLLFVYGPANLQLS